jgi:glycogen debranching enzyme
MALTSSRNRTENQRTITVPPRNRAARSAKLPTAGNGFLNVSGDFYILASSMASRRTTSVLSQTEAFAIFEASGDILESRLEALGFFYRDTRHLSGFEIAIAGEIPHLLNSYMSSDNAELRANLTNPDLRTRGDLVALPRNSIQIERSWTLCASTLFQWIVIRNYAPSPVSFELDFIFAADFADMFEVRGVSRKRKGRRLTPLVGTSHVEFRYLGLDAIARSTRISFNRKPRRISAAGASFSLNFARDASVELEVQVQARQGHADSSRSGLRPRAFAQALRRRRDELKALRTGFARIATASEPVNATIERSLADLLALTTVDARGCHIVAGIPWFATIFGRDSLITALSVLPFCPELAAGTLGMLARLQGSALDSTRDEEPGKIIHELRRSEMANTGEVPFGRYYGSIDSTPLFLWLFARSVLVTGELGLAEQLWPSVERALKWVELYGDSNGDGYIEYRRETPRGLANQGWKDSFDAISHADGTLAKAPIALAEVQGYLYAAYLGVAEVAARLGRNDLAARLSQSAAALKLCFARDFWLDRERTLALALDGQGRPCRVVASNAAHCLATGIVEGERAQAVADRLLEEDMFSGWGLRTLSARERRYNPMSYHNGSVWPHDNALAACGFARAGRSEAAAEIMTALFDASAQWNNRSLPELFCGFAREPRMGPVRYPVACHPQAWSAASVFALLQAVLAMEIHGFERRLVFRSAKLPPWLDWIKVTELKVGLAAVSFIARRSRHGAAIEVLEKRGDVSVEVYK